MYAIHLIIDGFFHDDLIITGNTVDDIWMKIDDVQNLDCLYRMGRNQETSEKGKESMSKLADFLHKFHSGECVIKDFEMLKLDISLGGFYVTDAVENEEDVAELKKKYPNAVVK